VCTVLLLLLFLLFLLLLLALVVGITLMEGILVVEIVSKYGWVLVWRWCPPPPPPSGVESVLWPSIVISSLAFGPDMGSALSYVG